LLIRASASFDALFTMFPHAEGMSAAAIADAPAATAPVTFTGQNRVFRRLVIRGALLELVTFGFYRFRLTTDIRRHLWSHTEIDGDALEYIGRGKELLLGFLIAMAVLAPVFLLNFLLGLEIERFKAFASLPLYLFLLAFGQFAAYRARRYRLTRTIWRGVRFWMTGSGWSYAWRSMLCGLLLFPTLGFAYPWRSAALERFKLRHTLYGNLPGRFEATGWQLFKRVWWVWLLGLLPLLLLSGGFAAISFAGGHADRPPAFRTLPPSAISAAAGFAMLLGGVLFLSLPFLHAIRRAREWAWWAAGIRFGSMAVACHLRSGSLIGIYWKLIGLALLVLAGYIAVGGGLAAALLNVHASSGGLLAMILARQLPVWGFAAFAATYLMLIIAIGVLLRIYTLQRVWRRVAAACAVINIDAASNVGAAGDVVSAFGEGLADGLDFGL
jgi:uncharacterized membrane protein YjgN (DUF898 family)